MTGCTNDEINLAAKYLKLDTKTVGVGLSLLIGAVVWCRDTTNKLDNLTVSVEAVTTSMKSTNQRIDTLVSSSYTANDAAKDFILRDQNISNLQRDVREIQEELKRGRTK